MLDIEKRQPELSPNKDMQMIPITKVHLCYGKFGLKLSGVMTRPEKS